MSMISFNKDLNRYEQTVGDHELYANVRREDGTLFIDYVYAAPALRGKGASSTFMKELMDIARQEKLKVVPVCGYAASWILRHPEYQ